MIALNPFTDEFTSLSFIINEDNFEDISIEDSAIDKFYYFKNKQKGLIKHFILKKGSRAQKSCDVTLIKQDSGKFTPRFNFYIWDITKKSKKEFERKELNQNFIKSNISLNDCYQEFLALLDFLKSFENIEIGDTSFKVVDKNKFILNFKTQEEVQKIKDLSQIFLEGDISEEDVIKALSDNRKKNLEEFRTLLQDTSYWNIYFENNKADIKGTGEEAVWHHFLKSNDWIIGLNVDIRFIKEFVDEVNTGIPDTTGKGSPNTDQIGWSDYTTLIEFKTPNTDIFTKPKKSTSRANTWSFSDSFIDGISQCLAQKFDWDKTHKTKDLLNNSQKIIDQNKTRTVDPKSIFIIGSKSREFSENSTNTNIITKRDTFERFRRNNRNVEIITFDELYERAYFIVYNEKTLDLDKITDNSIINPKYLPS